MPTHVIAYRSIIDSTRSRVLVGARSGIFFLNNNGREDLSKAILWGISSQFACKLA